MNRKVYQRFELMLYCFRKLVQIRVVIQAQLGLLCSLRDAIVTFRKMKIKFDNFFGSIPGMVIKRMSISASCWLNQMDLINSFLFTAQWIIFSRYIAIYQKYGDLIPMHK